MLRAHFGHVIWVAVVVAVFVIPVLTIGWENVLVVWVAVVGTVPIAVLTIGWGNVLAIARLVLG